MNKRGITTMCLALAVMAAAGGALLYLKSVQRLGEPGLKTTPIPGKLNVNIRLPNSVPGYKCTSNEIDEVTLATLPSDTSLAQNLYVAGDGFGIVMNVVLMGMDRTSIHKPQFCLVGQGLKIEKTEEVKVRISRPHDYELPVMKLTTSRERVIEGRKEKLSALYVYWFVADDKLTASHGERIWSMARTLITTGKLERWAYVSCLAYCRPGFEDMAFERMKQFIAQTVPQFQLVPAPPSERADLATPQ